MVSLDALLPHRPPIRLVEKILEVSAETTICRASISSRAPTADRGSASSILALEMAAQAAALIGASPPAEGSETADDSGKSDKSDKSVSEPRVGYLVRIRDAKLYQPRLPIDEPLRVSVTRCGGAGSLSMFEVSVVAESEPDRLLAEGRLSTLVT